MTGTIASTYKPNGSPRWDAEVRSMKSSEHPRRKVAGWILRQASLHDVVVLRGAVGLRDAYVDLLAGSWLVRHGTPVLFADATWEPGTRAWRRGGVEGLDAVPTSGSTLIRRMIHALDSPLTHYGVLSSHEASAFPRFWGVAAERVHFTPFCATADDVSVAVPVPGSVFAGGDSLRDYRALVAAASSIDGDVTIATHLPLPTASAARLEAGPLDEPLYARRAREAAVVVVPLMDGTLRSAGQQTYLNAMIRGQAVVVTEAPGVLDYIVPDVTGLVVPNRPEALAAAVNRLLADPGAAQAMGARAREDVLARFTIDRYFGRLADLARSLVD